VTLVNTLPPPFSRSSLRTAWPTSDDVRVLPDDLDKNEAQSAVVRGLLYDADGHDREVDILEAIPELTERQLLWVDVQGHASEDLDLIAAALKMPSAIASVLLSRGARAQLTRSDGYFHLGLPALRFTSKDEWRPVWLRFVWSQQVLITVHPHEVDALSGFRDQDRGETQIGALTGAVLCAALLDWHLASYFKASEALERAVDRFDERVLSRSPRDDLVEDLVRLRRRTSRVRRLLSPQREVFHGLTRPDIAEEIGEMAATHFVALGARFERTRESLEHATDLVHDAFSLHASRTAESVNAFLKTLTFGTFLLGAMGVVAGVLGMNFQAHLFESGERGFWAVVASLATLALTALIVARWRRWI
jgi:Mg2+ and Co2+ transporter CorA